MASTTGILSVSLPVADQDRALAFYRDVLGFEVRLDMEPWPGARLVEVVPPGSSVGIVLLPADTELPMAVRMSTPDAAAAHAELRTVAGVTLHNDELIELPGSAPMFYFADPDGNGLVYIQQEPADEAD